MKTVLAADDNEDDIFALKMACEHAQIPHRLQVVTDGEMAIDYLAGRGSFADRSTYPLPDLMFLDIKMPRKTGHEVLKWIRAVPALKQMPVIMLSDSAMPTDVLRAYELGASSYLQKIGNRDEFRRTIKDALMLWLFQPRRAARIETADTYRPQSDSLVSCGEEVIKSPASV